MSKLLVSAFEAFGGERVNPAKLALEALEAEDIVKLFLPVEYERASALLKDAIDALKPDAVISLGQAGGRDAVTPEKYAVNLRSSASPDSAGRLCRNEPIVPSGEEKLESTFGAEQIAKALREGGIPARVSESAGTYVCNDVMYSALHKLKDTGIPAGFIHVPYCREQLQSHPESFGMELSEIVRAVAIALNDIKQRIHCAE